MTSQGQQSDADWKTLTGVAECSPPARLTDATEVSGDKTADAGAVKATMSTVTSVGAFEAAHHVFTVATVVRSSVFTDFSDMEIVNLQQVTIDTRASQLQYLTGSGDGLP